MVEADVANGGHDRLSPRYCKEKHWHRYLAGFDFRYNNRSALGVEGKERATKVVVGAKGKRRTHRQPDSAKAPIRKARK